MWPGPCLPSTVKTENMGHVEGQGGGKGIRRSGDHLLWSRRNKGGLLVLRFLAWAPGLSKCHQH